MRISMWHLLVCAAVIGGGTAAIRADDNPDQAAARAALEAKLHEMGGQPANAQTSTPAKSAQPARPATNATTAPAQKSTNPPPAEKPAMTTAPAAAPAQKMRPAATAPSSNHKLFAPVPPPSGSTSGWSAANQSSTNRQTSPVIRIPVFSGTSQNTNAFNPGKELGLKPITAPPLPISAAQQAQLQTLLDKYDANVVSPNEYQAERAKILAEHK